MRTNFIRVENILSEIEDLNDKDIQLSSPMTEAITGIRVVKSERFQRYCLKCGKILPTKLKQNYTHNCEKPDFLL